MLRGQVIGTLRVMAGDTLLKELPLTAEADVPRLSYWEIWLRVFRSAFGKE